MWTLRTAPLTRCSRYLSVCEQGESDVTRGRGPYAHASRVYVLCTNPRSIGPKMLW